MAGKKERQRRLARERYERRLARQAQREQRVRRNGRIAGVVAVIVVLAGVVTYAALELTRSASASPRAAASATPSGVATSPSATPSPTPTGPVTDCVYRPSPPAARKVGFPPSKPDLKAHYRATITTNRGTIVVDLLNAQAPCTVNSFVFLAGKKYFNNTHCHRLTTIGIYVLQCGDPTGTGQGGPGYQFNDENLSGADAIKVNPATSTAIYPQATVAMANSGPNTNGSQFFFVYKTTKLPPAYTPFGEIVSGLNIIQQVAKAGTDNSNGPGDGHPKESVIIENVTIKRT